MYLVFFDEAKNDPDYPHYHIGAVCIDESHLALVEQQINALAEQIFKTSTLDTTSEFHAAEIYHRKKNFKDWNDFNRRIEVIRDLAKILSMEEVKLIKIQINCELLNTNQSPEDIAFMYLCERANGFIKARKALGMLLGDRENDHHAERYVSILSKYRANGTDFAFGRDIENLVDSVHFSHSHLSRFLQLADIYVWLLQFINRHKSSTNFRHRAMLDILKKDGIDLSPSKHKEWPKAP